MSAKLEYLLRLGDNDVVLAQRLGEWVGHGPVLEEDIALTNVGLDLIGQARLWYAHAGDVEARLAGRGRTEDELAYFRESRDFRNLLLVEQPNGNYADTIARQYLFDQWHVLLLADPEFTVGGTLAQVASIGFAHGNGSRPMTYSLASNRAPVRKGDVLLTTGSDTYAAGIPIGTVTAVAPDTNAISRTATVVPFVDVSSLDVVGVVVDPPRTKPRGLLRPIGPGPSPTSSPCPPAVPQGPVPTSTPTPTPTPVVTPTGTAGPRPSVTTSPTP